MEGLLSWQKRAFDHYKDRYGLTNIHVQIAGTGSGKTAAGAAMASYAFMMESKKSKETILLVACPYRSIKRGWSKWLKKSGIERTTTNNNRAADPSLEAIICTFGSMGEMLRLIRTWEKRVVLVLDEFHHLAEEGKWVECLMDEEVGNSSFITRAILLSGTPWHETGTLPSTLVKYDENGYVIGCGKPYTYGLALDENDAERNVVPVIFDFTHGVARQKKTNAETGEYEGERILKTEEMVIGDPLTPFVDFTSDSIYSYDAARDVVDKGVEKLAWLRSQDGLEYVGGMFIAKGMEQAKAIKNYLLNAYKKDSVLVLSDDPKSHSAIEAFEKSHIQEWLISVDMVSEGVDVPRLKVLCDLTNKKTLLHIIQRWGRVLRRVRKANGDFAINSSAFIFAIAHPQLVCVAKEIEDEVKKAKKEKGEGGVAPEKKSVYENESQDKTGDLIISQGEESERVVSELAEWLWANNWRQIRDGRRGHTDCMFVAKNMIIDGSVPSGFSANENGDAEFNKKEDPRDYDQKKNDAKEELLNETTRLANSVYSGSYSDANVYLNRVMGLTEWSYKSQPLEKIKERTEIARRAAQSVDFST